MLKKGVFDIKLIFFEIIFKFKILKHYNGLKFEVHFKLYQYFYHLKIIKFKYN